MSKQVSLTIRQLLLDLEEGTKEYYPLNRIHIKDPVGALSLEDAKTSRLTALKLNKIEQLTDMFFYVLCHKVPPHHLAGLEVVDCTGCVYITDAGIQWLLQAVEKANAPLKEVLFQGCRKVTSASLYNLKHCKCKLSSVDLRMCGLEVALTGDPDNPADDTCNTSGCPCAITTTQNVHVNGTDKSGGVEQHRYLGYFNPYDFSMFPSTSVQETQEKEDAETPLLERSHYKVVVPHMAKASWNMVDAIKGKAEVSANDPQAASVLLNFSDGNQNDNQTKTYIYNWVECNEYLLRVFLCDGCIVLLPVQQNADYNAETWAREAVNIIVRVLQQVESVAVQFGIAAFGKENFADPYKEELFNQLRTLEEQLQKDIDELLNNLAGLNFHGQENARLLCLLHDNICSLIPDTSEPSVKSPSRPEIKTISPSFEEKNGHVSIEKASLYNLLSNMGNSLLDMQIAPWYSKFTPRFQKFQTSVEVKTDICPADEIIPEILKKLDFKDCYNREKAPKAGNMNSPDEDDSDSDSDSDWGASYENHIDRFKEKEAKFESPAYYSALNMMHRMGVIVYLPFVRSRPVATDVDNFVNLCNELFSAGKTGGSSVMKFLDKNVSVFTTKDLENILAKLGMKNTKLLYIEEVLHDLGLICLDKTEMVLYSSLSSSTRVPLMSSDVDSGENILEVAYAYHMHHKVSKAPLSLVQHNILNIVSSMHDVDLLWNDGLLLHEGLVNICLSTDGKVMELRGQMFQSGSSDDGTQSDPSLANKLLWTTVEKYKVAVDYTLQQAHIHAKVEITKGGIKPEDIVPVHHGHDTKPVQSKDNDTIFSPACRICGMPADKLAILWGMYKDLNPTFMQEVGILREFNDYKKSVPQENLDFMDGNGLSATAEIGIAYPLDPFGFNEATLTMLKPGGELQFAVAFTSGESESFNLGSTYLGIDMMNGIVVQSKETEDSDSDISEDDAFAIPAFKKCPNFRLVFRLDLPNKPGMLPWTLLVNDVKITTGETEGNVAYMAVHGISGRGAQSLLQLNRAPRPIFSSDAGIKVGMRMEAWDPKTPRFVCTATVGHIDPDAKKIKIHFDGWKGYDYWIDVTSPQLHPVGFMELVGHKQKSKYVTHVQPPKFYGNQGGVFEWQSYLQETSSKPVPWAWFNKDQTEGMKAFIKDPPSVSTILPSGPDGGQANLVPRRLDMCSSLGHSAGAIMSSLRKLLNGMELTATMGSLLEDPTICLLPSPQLIAKSLAQPGRHDMNNFHKHAVHFLCARTSQEVHLIDCAGEPLPEDVNMKQLIGPLFLGTACLYQAENFVPKKCKNLLIDPEDFDKVQAQLRRLLELYLLSYCMMKEGPLQPEPGISKYLKSWQWTPDTKQELQKLWSSVAKPEVKTVLKSVPDQQYFACQVHDDQFLERFSQGSGQEFYQSYAHLINNLRCDSVTLPQQLPNDIWQVFSNIEELILCNAGILELPVGLGHCKNLAKVDVHFNRLTGLPDDLEHCKKSLTHLDISDNPMDNIPKVVFKLERLERLIANNICLNQLPDEIANLKHLNICHIAGHTLADLPKTFHLMGSLRDLDISGVRWLVGYDQPKSLLVQAEFMDYAVRTNAFKHWTKEAIMTLFSECDDLHRGTLEFNQIQKLNALLFQKFTRFGSSADKMESDGLFPANLLPPGQTTMLDEGNGLKLENLVISFHGFTSIPDQIVHIPLESLDISHNPRLEVISGKVGLLPVKAIHLKGCPSLRTPPKEIVSRGFQAVKGYLHRLTMGSTTCTRTKLMLVGLGGAGKTSLIKSLMNVNHKSSGTTAGEVTDGIDIKDWNVTPKGRSFKITYSIWDFAGQTVYYNTHQFFLSNRAVYFLVWNVRLGHEHAGLDFWLNSIACHAPKAPIFIVGTHIDQVEKAGLPAEEMAKRYPQIAAFHYVSAFTGQGVSDLVSDLTQATLKEKYIGEEIPVAWLALEKTIKKKQKETAIINWSEMVNMAEEQGIVEREVNEAVQFLHNLGSLQHFVNEYLKSRVVINPQWIVDVMSCIVSVHENSIKDGRFLHKDIRYIWDPATYPSELHDWLLRLTEEFDLTFPLRDEACSLVPCLLPDRTPEFEWPNVDEQEEVRETKMMYRFDYLPAGLFNRAQVRLYQFSDSSVIWKRGSLLKKNNHLALMQQTKKNEVMVKVQGPRPENILFLIHEVFEGLVTESFHGVRYDFYVPCINCLESGTLEPCLFAGSRVRRALQLKAPFMQCYDNFHTLSITELQAMLPPDNNTDFDVHLQRTMHDLRHVRNDMSVNVFMLYCKSDVPKEDERDTKINPSHIKEDLEEAGISVLMHEACLNTNWVDIMRTLKDAQILVACISENFVNDEACHRLFVYARQTMGKRLQLVLLGKGRDFMKGDLGLLIAHEVFVNLQDPKRYGHKIKELVEGVKTKLATTGTSKMVPPVFISYCWANSKDAVKKGTKSKEGSLGWADPRQMKTHMEKGGIHCWMDIEQAGKTGLFEDIAQGLKKAKVVVACVSDEYVQSKNCCMEFRFATVMLKVPVIMAVVGTGYKWVASEVGMLSLGFPQISFQQEDPEAFHKLLDLVKSYLPDDQEKVEQQLKEKALINHEYAYKELVELIQRKFLRQLVLWSDALGMEPFPRLIFIDFVEDHLTLPPVKLDMGEVISEENKEDKEAPEKEESCQHSCDAMQSDIDVRHMPDGSDRPSSSSTHGQLSARKMPKHSMKSLRKGHIKPKKGAKCEDSSSESENERSVTVLSTARSRRPKSGYIHNIKGKVRPLSAQKEEAPVFVVGQKPVGFRLMCEHEEGWHTVGECLPWRHDSQDKILEVWAPYLARLAAILRDTNLNLSILTTQEGQEFLEFIENLCDDNTDFQDAYTSLYKFVLEADKESTHGNLKRCHLPSGKVVWLCPEHQQNSRLTILTHEGNTTGGIATEADRTLAEQIKEMLGETDNKEHNIKLRGQFIGARVAVETVLNYEKNYKGKKPKSPFGLDQAERAQSSKKSATPKTETVYFHRQGSGITNGQSETASSTTSEQTKGARQLAAAARTASGQSPVSGSKACTLM